MSITFVTCVYCARPDSTKTKDEYYNTLWSNFSKLLNELPSNCKIVVFSEEPRITDERIFYVIKKLDDYHIVPLVKNCELPSERNETKDTIDYLALMNCKAEMLNIAKTYCDTKHLCWIDCGITKIFERSVASELKVVSYLNYPDDKIVIAGCHGKTPIDRNKILWRFCGGFLVIPCSLVEIFYLLCCGEICNSNIATWEVNIWALLEEKIPHIFKWYPGDHNERIFPVILKLIANR